MTTPPVSDEAVEVAARAMCIADGRDPDGFDVMFICGPNNEPMPCWRGYVEMANAALTAAAPFMRGDGEGRAKHDSALIGPINTTAIIEQYSGDARLWPQNLVALARALDAANTQIRIGAEIRKAALEEAATFLERRAMYFSGSAPTNLVPSVCGDGYTKLCASAIRALAAQDAPGKE